MVIEVVEEEEVDYWQSLNGLFPHIHPQYNPQQEIDKFPVVDSDVELAVVEEDAHTQLHPDKLMSILTLAHILTPPVALPEAIHNYTFFHHPHSQVERRKNQFADVNAVRYCHSDSVWEVNRSQVVDEAPLEREVNCRNHQDYIDLRRMLDDVEGEIVYGWGLEVWVEDNSLHR
jgi:hypothetical protein